MVVGVILLKVFLNMWKKLYMVCVLLRVDSKLFNVSVKLLFICY